MVPRPPEAKTEPKLLIFKINRFGPGLASGGPGTMWNRFFGPVLPRVHLSRACQTQTSKEPRRKRKCGISYFRFSLTFEVINVYSDKACCRIKPVNTGFLLSVQKRSNNWSSKLETTTHPTVSALMLALMSTVNLQKLLRIFFGLLPAPLSGTWHLGA